MALPERRSHISKVWIRKPSKNGPSRLPQTIRRVRLVLYQCRHIKFAKTSFWDPRFAEVRYIGRWKAPCDTVPQTRYVSYVYLLLCDDLFIWQRALGYFLIHQNERGHTCGTRGNMMANQSRELKPHVQLMQRRRHPRNFRASCSDPISINIHLTSVNERGSRH